MQHFIKFDTNEYMTRLIIDETACKKYLNTYTYVKIDVPVHGFFVEPIQIYIEYINEHIDIRVHHSSCTVDNESEFAFARTLLNVEYTIKQIENIIQ